MVARAATFVRYDGADGTGHIGWAFDVDASATECGAVEDPLSLPSCDPADMGFWNEDTPEPVALMAQHAPPYDALKYVDLESADVAAAQATVAWVAAQPYAFIGRNCMDDVYDVLRAFGVPNLPPPAEHWFPNNWFATFAGTLEPMTFRWRPAQPDVAVAAVEPARSGARPRPAAAAPRWRIEGTPEWHDLQVQLAAQSGIPSVRARATRFRTR